MDFIEMVDRVTRAGGIDVEPALAGGWLNDRYRAMCVRSKFTKQRVVLGDTVADQSAYEIPADVDEILELAVGTTPYARTGLQTRLAIQGKLQSFIGPGGFYSPGFDENGQHQVELLPTPGTSGIEVSVYAVVTPPPLQDNQVPVIPIDFHRYLVEGAVADGLAFLDENLQAADRYEARYDDAIERLRRRVNSKIGNGPYFVQIEGVHFSR